MTLPDRCLLTQRVLSALTDGRPVARDEADAARTHAATCAACTEAARAFARLRVELGMMPELAARDAFTERVLAARERTRRAEAAEILPFARRLTAAAALALVLSAGWATLAPLAPVEATDATLTTPHWVDLFRADPFDADDVDAGLRALLRDDAPQRALARRAASATPEER